LRKTAALLLSCSGKRDAASTAAMDQFQGQLASSP
jgi:hypothetical protein